MDSIAKEWLQADIDRDNQIEDEINGFYFPGYEGPDHDADYEALLSDPSSDDDPLDLDDDLPF